jgi:hypothetical protein
MSFVIFEHSLISECQRVAIEAELRRPSIGVRHRDNRDGSQPTNTR